MDEITEVKEGSVENIQDSVEVKQGVILKKPVKEDKTEVLDTKQGVILKKSVKECIEQEYTIDKKEEFKSKLHNLKDKTVKVTQETGYNIKDKTVKATQELKNKVNNTNLNIKDNVKTAKDNIVNVAVDKQQELKNFTKDSVDKAKTTKDNMVGAIVNKKEEIQYSIDKKFENAETCKEKQNNIIKINFTISMILLAITIILLILKIISITTDIRDVVNGVNGIGSSSGILDVIAQVKGTYDSGRSALDTLLGIGTMFIPLIISAQMFIMICISSLFVGKKDNIVLNSVTKIINISAVVVALLLTLTLYTGMAITDLINIQNIIELLITLISNIVGVAFIIAQIIVILTYTFKIIKRGSEKEALDNWLTKIKRVIY